MNEETSLLLRYADGELSVDEARKFRARLAASPALRKKLQEMRRMGGLLRVWAKGVEPRAANLVEPTLLRVHQAQRRSARAATWSCALAAALIVVSPWSQRPAQPSPPARSSEPVAPAAAAIERIDAGDTQAQVFLVGSSSTPVVWLADDAQDEDDESVEQGPG